MASISPSQDIVDSAPPPHAELTRFARHYRLETVVASGPWSAVWRALDERRGETVALKFFPPDLLRTTADLAYLRDVLAPVRLLRHDGIVAAREVVTSGNYAAIVMPWIEGATLAQVRLARPDGCCDIPEVERWMHELADALVAAEAGGVVHGALNPHVIFVRPDGRMAVSGFGINAWMRAAARQVYGKLAGNEDSAWLSPAQLRGEPPRSSDDVYAFGAVVYELITGTPPGLPTWWGGHRQPSAMATRRRKYRRAPIAIPSSLELVVQSCLEPDESRRLPGFREVLTRLNFGSGMLHPPGSAAPQPAPPPQAAPPAAPVSSARAADAGDAAPERTDELSSNAAFTAQDAAEDPLTPPDATQGSDTRPPTTAAEPPLPSPAAVESADRSTAQPPVPPARPDAEPTATGTPDSPPISSSNPAPEQPAPPPLWTPQPRATPAPSRQAPTRRGTSPRPPRGAGARPPAGAYAAPLVGRSRSPMGVTILLRGLVAATILGIIATGGWFGLRVFTQWEDFNALMTEVREFPPTAGDTQRADFEHRLAEAEARLSTERAVQLRSAWNARQRDLAELKVRAASLPGGIEVRSQPAGARVSIGNRPPQPTPFRVEDVPPGTYEVRATLDNHEPFTGTVAVPAGGVVDLPIQFERPVGSLQVESSGDQLMYEVRDEQEREPARRGFTPVTLELPQGRYRIVFHGGSGPIRDEVVEVRGGETVEIRADPPPVVLPEEPPSKNDAEDSAHPDVDDWLAAIDPSPFAVREPLPRPKPAAPVAGGIPESIPSSPDEPSIAVSETPSSPPAAESDPSREIAELAEGLPPVDPFKVPEPPPSERVVMHVEPAAPDPAESVAETQETRTANTLPPPKAPVLEDPPSTGGPLPELPPVVSRPSVRPSFEEYNRIFDLSEVNIAPQLLERADPDIPRWLARGRKPVRIELLVVIDRFGRVSSARTSSTTHDELVEPTLRAVRLWRFSPARKDGHAVAVRLTIPLVFRSE